MRHNLIVDAIQVVPGALPDGTAMVRFRVETANLGTLDWFLSRRQAMTVAGELEEFGTAQ